MILIRRVDLREDDVANVVSPLFAIADVERALVKRDVSRKRWAREIGQALWRGEIVAVRADDERTTTPSRTWIEIQLFDRDDRPVPHRAYRLRCPNGEVRTGLLDEYGFARIEEIDGAGACAVWCPLDDMDDAPVSRPTGARHAFVLDDRNPRSGEDTLEWLEGDKDDEPVSSFA